LLALPVEEFPMSGQVHWFPILIVLFGAAATTAAVLLLSRRHKHLKRLHQPIPCPPQNRELDATVVRDEHAHRWTGVVQCEAFQGEVTCEKKCVEHMNIVEQRDRLAAGDRGEVAVP